MFIGVPEIQYVQLVTAAAHGRATGQRISVAGVEASGGAGDICAMTDLSSGVIDDTSLSIPIATTGTYTPGSPAVKFENNSGPEQTLIEFGSRRNVGLDGVGINFSTPIHTGWLCDSCSV